MKKNFLVLSLLASITTFSVNAQTWNIPGAGTTNAGYIGTTSNNDVSIYANNATRVTVKANGNVGIGTASPTAKLHVNGNLSATGIGTTTLYANNGGGVTLTVEGTTTSLIEYQNYDDTWDIGVVNANSMSSGASWYRIQPLGGTTGITVDFSGRVLIGASSWPSNTSCNQLHVAGTIGAQEVNVSTTDWCDFVFDVNYQLKPILEVEKYIQVNKHLPEVPSEKQMIENGIVMSEMMKLYMKKIEELTLYVIDLQKKNDQLEAKVAQINK